MKNILVSIALLLFPAYSFIAWIITFNQFKTESQNFKVEKYKEMYFINTNFNVSFITILSILMAVSAIFVLLKQNEPKTLIIRIALLILALSLISINVWSLL